MGGVEMTAPPAARCDACVCDLDGVVAGVYNGARGGCAAGRELVQQLVQKTTAPVPLCPVPKECADAGVQNATAAMQTSASTIWAQPGGFSWRACTVGDPASDACDPSGVIVKLYPEKWAESKAALHFSVGPCTRCMALTHMFRIVHVRNPLIMCLIRTANRLRYDLHWKPRTPRLCRPLPLVHRQITGSGE